MNGKKQGREREIGAGGGRRPRRKGGLKPLACALILAAPAVQAQTETETASARTLAPITVSANPLGLDLNSTTLPASVLEGDALIEQRTGTLGETLKNLPGVNSDTFGAGASRPVIRGQTAPRVKVLSDGSEVMDASGISPDHAVTVEPLLAERIEVLRGPATLLYGGGAIGGVVNVVDKKVPTAVPEKGIEAEAELRGAKGP
jgi:iron complex outermembrane receptor protein